MISDTTPATLGFESAALRAELTWAAISSLLYTSNDLGVLTSTPAQIVDLCKEAYDDLSPCDWAPGGASISVGFEDPTQPPVVTAAVSDDVAEALDSDDGVASQSLSSSCKTIRFNGDEWDKPHWFQGAFDSDAPGDGDVRPMTMGYATAEEGSSRTLNRIELAASVTRCCFGGVTAFAKGSVGFDITFSGVAGTTFPIKPTINYGVEGNAGSSAYGIIGVLGDATARSEFNVRGYSHNRTNSTPETIGEIFHDETNASLDIIAMDSDSSNYSFRESVQLPLLEANHDDELRFYVRGTAIGEAEAAANGGANGQTLISGSTRHIQAHYVDLELVNDDHWWTSNRCV